MSTPTEQRKGGTREISEAEGKRLEQAWAEKMERNTPQPAPVTEQEGTNNAD